MKDISEDAWLLVFRQLDAETLWNALIASKRWARIIASSKKLMQNELKITPEIFPTLLPGGELSNLPFKNISIKSIKGKEQLRIFSKLIKKQKEHLEILDIENFQRATIPEVIEFFKGFTSLITLKLRQCHISEEVNRQILNSIPTLKEVTFEKCDGNYFKIFHHQISIEKIIVRNLDYTWVGFVHDDFVDLARTLRNLDFLVLEGIGTGSFFDFNNFPFKVRKLDTCVISFHWYVGIRTPRKRFLEAQKGTLEDLTIHNLPYDFDGGKLLKFTIEQMGLKTFYYGKIPLILNGMKQAVTEFSANQTQICSLFEMFHQFPTITRFKLILTESDVDSREIENLINPPTNLFNNVNHLEIDDKSGYQCTLGLFLGLLRNFRNISSLKLQSQDRNINVLLQELLSRMRSIREIYIDSMATRKEERMNIIRNFIPHLKKIFISSDYVQEAMEFFGENVEVFPISNTVN